MAKLYLKEVSHSYDGEKYALTKIDHVFADGKAYALLGPSGCGKTTLLNIISGLLIPTSGAVIINDQDFTQLPPEKRNIAQVFQFPVVYDTMSVYDNLAFPLRNRKLKETEIHKKVTETLEILDLSEVAQNIARNLSAEHKQKISLGRGLVRTDVNAILFDEPLTVIDPHLKWQLRSQLKILHQRESHTMIYVTHDQTEALTFADEVVVLFDGQVVQIGTPEKLFTHPEHTFVGFFVGSPGMNILKVNWEKDAAVLASTYFLADGAPPDAYDKIEIGIRPEYVKLGNEGMPAQVYKVDDIGRAKMASIKLGSQNLKAIIDSDYEIPSEPRVSFPPDNTHFFADSWRFAGGKSEHDHPNGQG